MLVTLGGGYILLHPIGVEDHADIIVILYGTKGERACDLRHSLPLRHTHGTEVLTPRDIHEKDHSKLSLLLVDLDVRTGIACGDIPVDISDIIPRLVLSHLAKGHSSSLEG